jgi:hypothetical protein
MAAKRAADPSDPKESRPGAPAKRARPSVGHPRPSLAQVPQAPEPTVLDWFNSLLRLRPIPIPGPGAALTAARPRDPVPAATPAAAGLGIRITAAQLRFPVALILAFLAQIGLERRQGSIGLSVALYLIAAGLTGWAAWARDFEHTASPAAEEAAPTRIRLPYLGIAILLTALTYLTTGDNLFRPLTVPLWAGSIIMAFAACWEGDLGLERAWRRLSRWAGKPRLRFEVDPWVLLWLAGFALTAFFRFHQLEQVPYEMWSDHAEKILDVIDILNGQTSIFFPRNAGREGLQFYLTAAAVKWFEADLSFMTLKLITALGGLLTLPFIYLLGKELAGRWVGWIAMLLAGISYWPNVLSRVGMRLPFHPVFLAPAMFFLVRGLRQGRRNDLLFSGLAVGAGLYGYTAARITPLVILLGLIIFLLHRTSWPRRKQALLGFAMLVLVALVVSTPFLHVAYEKQEDVFYRTVTRMTEAERPLPGEPLQIFFTNMWHALRMFAWDDGEIWVLAVPFRPMLDWVVGGLFHIGLVVLGVRYLRNRGWPDLLLLISIPVLLLPSVLALAFPGENPHPSRAGGAIVPVFIIAALPLASFPSWAGRALSTPRARLLGYGLAGAVFFLAAAVNYQLTFQEYGVMVRRGAWNTSEVGAFVRGFAQSVGSYENVYVVSYPHWMDSRLVATISGRPGQDFGIWADQLGAIPETSAAQLFLLHPDAQSEIDFLRDRYPNGTLQRLISETEGRDFMAFFVPASGDESEPEEQS